MKLVLFSQKKVQCFLLQKIHITPSHLSPRFLGRWPENPTIQVRTARWTTQQKSYQRDPYLSWTEKNEQLNCLLHVSPYYHVSDGIVWEWVSWPRHNHHVESQQFPSSHSQRVRWGLRFHRMTEDQVLLGCPGFHLMPYCLAVLK